MKPIGRLKRTYSDSSSSKEGGNPVRNVRQRRGLVAVQGQFDDAPEHPVRNARQRHGLTAEQALEHEQQTLEHEQQTLEHEQQALKNAQQALEHDDILVLRKLIRDRKKTISKCETTVKVRKKVLREKERRALEEQGNQPDERVVQQQLLLDQQHDRAREIVDIQRMAQQNRERPAHAAQAEQAARPKQAAREAQAEREAREAGQQP